MYRETIVKSIIINYPILQVHNFCFPKVLVLWIDPGQMKNISNILNTKDEYLVVADSNTKINELKHLITEYRCTPILYVYDKSDKTKEVIKIFSEANKMHRLGDKKVCAFPIIITDSPVHDLNNEMFIISLSGDLSHINIPPEKVLFKEERVLSAKNLLLKDGKFDDNIRFILEAVALLLCEKNKEEAFYERYKKEIDLMIEQNEEMHDASNYSDVFLHTLAKWQESNEFSQVCNLPNVDNKTEELLNETIFYDEDYLYISEDLFRQIVVDITYLIPINALKNGLREVGIIVCERNANSYVSKMNYYKENGKFVRKRMLRFNRSKITKPGNLDFILTCEMSRKKVC